MNFRALDLALLLASVTCAGIAQLFLKASVRAWPSPLRMPEDFWRLINTPLVIGLTIFAMSVVIWLVALMRVPISLAYPFTAVGITITLIGGALLFGEQLTMGRILSVLVILAGVTSLAFSR